ncbi:MAG: HEAT repeat domain-containing protein [Tangfeifania sp.]
MTNKKLDKKLERELFSAQSENVISALNSLKEEGNIHYLPILFDLLNADTGKKIEEEIINILGSLKVQDAAPVLAEALQDPKYKPIRKPLTAACWQNSLNFKEHLPVFVDLVIEEDFETGFEAFTVIESMEKYPEGEVIENVTNRIHDALPNANEQKKYFLHEILTLIR